MTDITGTVIDHLASGAGRYLGSPSLAALDGGDLVVSHDIFGPGSGRDHTQVFRSADGGRTWERIADIDGQWWSSLFVRDGALYLLGTSCEYGTVVIRRSDDGGRTWTVPRDERTGLLRPDGRFHCAPVPVVEHAGRLWRAMESVVGDAGWPGHFRAFMMSADIDADLLDARAWRSTNALGCSDHWLGGGVEGWLEGNAVVLPDGGIGDVLRVEYWRGDTEKSAIIRIDPAGERASFDPADFIDLPGGGKKFTIRHDPASSRYWTLANSVPDPARAQRGLKARNTLTLQSSPDLRDWTVHRTLLHHEEDLFHAFQYVDWLFHGDDIRFVSRTAADDSHGGAHNYHDSNYITFHTVTDFRRS